MDRLRFVVNRIRGRPTVLELRLLGVPITLVVDAGRELRRAHSVDAEEGLLQRVFDALRPGDVFYDVGANIGVIGLLVALHPRGREVAVECFEPEPKNFEALTRNVAINRMVERVRCHRLAFTNAEGAVELFVRGGRGEGRHSTVARAGSTGSIEVPATTIDAFVAATGPLPTVLKLDVEGAEGRVLEGAHEALRARSVRDLFVEIHDKGDGDRMPDGASIEDWLARWGYEKVWENDRGRSRHCHFRVGAAGGRLGRWLAST